VNPKSIREAVASFFERGTDPSRSTAGRIQEWSRTQRAEVASGITLAATGVTAQHADNDPCFSIADSGEGQTPDKMPDTFLSLDRKNKQRIPFVQGKFNMGGTGVLQFCGRHNLQLIVSRRNPHILPSKHSTPSDAQWGFTIVRREDPRGGYRNSVYTYLAPVGAEQKAGKGGVLRFTGPSMPIFPEGNKAYARAAEWGTLIKLYEYALSGSRTHILRRDGLLSRIDLLLPDIALPIRLHECRAGYKGHEGSFHTPLAGVSVRLEDDKGENLEPGFPNSSPLVASGEEMIATIYAFKKGKADTYRRNEGIIFTNNGQTHGFLTKDFFTRRNAGRLNYIADSVFVVVDCSKFSTRAREDFFMNSRDRLRARPLRSEIEAALEDLLKHSDPLRELKERRQRDAIGEKLEDSKPLEDVLRAVLKHSPTLSTLFLQGARLSNPFKTQKVQGREDKPFHGKRYPTYFKFKDLDYGAELRRNCHVNYRCRIVFETDAENDYLSRKIDMGEFSLRLVAGDREAPVENYVGPHLQNGIATLSLQLPANCRVGDVLSFRSTVTDATQLDPFQHHFTVRVREEAEPSGGKGGTRKPPSTQKGDDRETESGISLPNVTPVYEGDWLKQEPPFDKYTALRVKTSIGSDSGEEKDVYDFFINMDNIYLNSELKVRTTESDLIRARFKYGMVLLGLALIHQDRHDKRHDSAANGGNREDDGEAELEPRIEYVTKAIAPVLLPVIESLGTLDLSEQMPADTSGEET
jgi:hypothetical protein